MGAALPVAESQDIDEIEDKIPSKVIIVKK